MAAYRWPVGLTAQLPHTTLLPVLLALFLTCFVALVAATVLLLALGQRVRVASWSLGLALGVVVAVAAGRPPRACGGWTRGRC
jgi:hypothetical protein